MVERRFPKPNVVGSSPTGREISIYKDNLLFKFLLFKLINMINKIINFLFLSITVSNTIIYILKLCFSEIFLVDTSSGIEVVFSCLGILLSFPLFLTYESLYQSLKKNFFMNHLVI